MRPALDRGSGEGLTVRCGIIDANEGGRVTNEGATARGHSPRAAGGGALELAGTGLVNSPSTDRKVVAKTGQKSP